MCTAVGVEAAVGTPLNTGARDREQEGGDQSPEPGTSKPSFQGISVREERRDTPQKALGPPNLISAVTTKETQSQVQHG